MTKKITFVSIVFPVFNEEENLEKIYREVKEACIQHGIDYEMIFIDNGSTDNSLALLKKLKIQDKKGWFFI